MKPITELQTDFDYFTKRADETRERLLTQMVIESPFTVGSPVQLVSGVTSPFLISHIYKIRSVAVPHIKYQIRPVTKMEKIGDDIIYFTDLPVQGTYAACELKHYKGNLS